VTYFGSAIAQSWHGQMIAAALGGTLLFISILMFAIVAVGTYVRNEHAAQPEDFPFAAAEEDALPTPPVFDSIGRWGLAAVALALIAYAGPIYQQLSVHHYLAPGLRTW